MAPVRRGAPPIISRPSSSLPLESSAGVTHLLQKMLDGETNDGSTARLGTTPIDRTGVERRMSIGKGLRIYGERALRLEVLADKAIRCSKMSNFSVLCVYDLPGCVDGGGLKVLQYGYNFKVEISAWIHAIALGRPGRARDTVTAQVQLRRGGMQSGQVPHLRLPHGLAYLSTPRKNGLLFGHPSAPVFQVQRTYILPLDWTGVAYLRYSTRAQRVRPI
ncbi:hypothetical protein CORC01_09162 [Colletotrichum orchidophilum]|uniref:Uncharacterized protein n=1 Tax=Colletotrichum orchidophilum TaxID=1209926 RepID=A0A1G4B2P3_9PEZI|nr:uncharacterized protein CORC01_09162 [Colletotrichum orchidophilum]OHE95572.1 hypothetical protein CORC01_09162 [Colletotrichum orchidophilum]